jgi:hypothetical protein
MMFVQGRAIGPDRIQDGQVAFCVSHLGTNVASLESSKIRRRLRLRRGDASAVAINGSGSMDSSVSFSHDRLILT